MDRRRRLEAARNIDWRFLLSEPELGRVAVVDASAETAAALTELSHDAVVRSPDDLAATGDRWDVVVLGEHAHAHRHPALLRVAAESTVPGGWLIVELPARAGVLGHSSRVGQALRAEDVDVIRPLWLLPNRRAPTRIVPLRDPVAVRLALTRHGSSGRRRALAAAARAVTTVAPADVVGGSVTLLARRSTEAPASGWPGLGRLAALLSARTGLTDPSWVLLTPRFRASAHVILLAADRNGRVQAVAKIARLPEAGGGVDREAENLVVLADAGVAAASIPTVLAAERIGGGHAVLVETALEGRPLDRAALRRDPARWIRAATRWLGSMPLGDRAGPNTLSSLLEDPIRELTAVLGEKDDDRTATLADRTMALVAPLADAALPLVFEHGDLSHPNILVRPNGELGILDWESARADGLPLHDLAFFLGYVALSTATSGEDPHAAFERTLATPTWGAVDALHAEAARLGISRQLVPALVLGAWARAAAGLLDRLAIDRTTDGSTRGWVRDNRYYATWEGAVRHHDRLTALLS